MVFVDMKNIVDVDRSKIEFNEGDGKGKISFPLRKDLDGDTHLVANIGDELKIDFNEKDLNIFLKECFGSDKVHPDNELIVMVCIKQAMVIHEEDIKKLLD